MANKKTYRTEDIKEAFRKRYKQPEYAAFFEVSNATGVSGGRRYADGIVMSLWPSRGLHLHGFEFKVSRSDWTKELKSPEKAELLAARCHTWTVITANDIVKPGEMPEGWGHMILTGRGLQAIKAAPIREPEEPSWSWIAAILRRAGEVTSSTIETAINERDKCRAERYQENVEKEVQRRTRELTEKAQKLDELLEALGLNSESSFGHMNWETVQIIECAKILRAAGLDNLSHFTMRSVEALEERTAAARKLVEILDEIRPQSDKLL